jgi:hypothetical protein
MKKRAIITLGVSLYLISHLSNALGYGNPPLFKETELKLNVDDFSAFNIDVGAGDIEVKGKPGRDEIIVRAKVYGKRITEDDYTLTLKTKGNKARLVASFNGESKRNEHIDLEVFMPSKMALNLTDRSGDIKVDSIDADLVINDRSGDVQLTDISGSVSIEDRSGDLTISRLGGDLDIEDRSGDIELKDLGGDVTIQDSSGDVYVKDAVGKVTVSDSSGDINVNGAADFKLKSDSSGNVRLRNIRNN